MSVAELCRRLGSAPATTDSVPVGAAPVLVGDLLRREGRPPVPAARVAPSPELEPDEDQPVVPTPRSRGDACRTALGAGGLVVAGSVLGAALLAAAGVGGPLPFGQNGDDPAGQFQGEGTLVKPGTAYGSVRGRDVVARSGLLRAIAYYAPFRSSTGAADRAGARTTGPAAVVPVAGPARLTQALAPAGVAATAGPTPGIATQVVGGVTQTTGPVLGGVTDAAAPVLGGVTDAAAPVLGGVTGAAGPVLGEVTGPADSVLGGVTGAAGPVLGEVADAATPVATVIAPLASDVAGVVTPVAELASTVTAPVVEGAAPVLEVAAPLVNAAAPVVAGTEAVIQPVVAVAGPAVAPALNAVGPVLAFADPLLPSPEELTDPVVDRAGGVADDLPAIPGSFAQAATGNAVSAVRDAAAGTTSAVQAATDTAHQVLPSDPAGTAGRVVARTQTAPVDPPTLPLPIVAPQVTDAAGVLTKVVPVQATDSPEPAVMDTTLPTRVLSSQGVAAPKKTEAQTTAEAEPPTEPLRIVAPLDDPEPSAEPRTAPLRIVGPETSDGTRAESKPDAPTSRRLPAADALTDKAGALLGR